MTTPTEAHLLRVVDDLREEIRQLRSANIQLGELSQMLVDRIPKSVVNATQPPIQTHPGGSSLIAERDSFARALVSLERVITEQISVCPFCRGYLALPRADSYSHRYYCSFVAAAKRMAEIGQGR